MFQGAVADSLTVADEGLNDPGGQHAAAVGDLAMPADAGLFDEFHACAAVGCSGEFGVQARVI